jgi:hypothetical protein
MTSDSSAETWAPTACTLPTAERPLRLAEFDGLFATALQAIGRTGPTQLTLTFVNSPGCAELVRDLTRRESACCSFFRFDLDEHDGLLHLEVAVPTRYTAVLEGFAARAQRALSTAGRKP